MYIDVLISRWRQQTMEANCVNVSSSSGLTLALISEIYKTLLKKTYFKIYCKFD